MLTPLTRIGSARWLVLLSRLIVSLLVMLAATACPSAEAAGWTQFQVPAAAIAAGPDGNLWVTDGNGIERVTPSGSSTGFAFAHPPFVDGIATGPDGNLWFMEYGFIGRITTSGTLTEFPIPTANVSCLPSEDFLARVIIAGPDGNLWFTNSLDSIDRITDRNAVFLRRRLRDRADKRP